MKSVTIVRKKSNIPLVAGMTITANEKSNSDIIIILREIEKKSQFEKVAVLNHKQQQQQQ